MCYLCGIWGRLEQLERIYGRFPSVDQSGSFAGVPNLGKPLYREKTIYIKTHKMAINRPVDHTGETHILSKVSCFLLKSFHFCTLQMIGFFSIQILIFRMLRNNADVCRCSYFELGLPVVSSISYQYVIIFVPLKTKIKIVTWLKLGTSVSSTHIPHPQTSGAFQSHRVGGTLPINQSINNLYLYTISI